MSSVDVVVPCYNYGHYLRECVDSILSQAGVDVRVLIIDDASSDDTPQVGEQLATEDPRVEFRRHDVNRGHIITYNEGLLAWATAKYSLLLSADDRLAPGALARAVALMDHHDDVGMTYGMAYIFTDEYAGLDDANPVSDYRIVPGAAFLKFCCEHTFNPVPTPTAVVRTELQHRIGGYCAAFPHAGDEEMWMRFATHAPVGILRAVQGYYRWHGNNMSQAYYNQLLGDRREWAEACQHVLERCRAQFPESTLWVESMRRALAKEACARAANNAHAGEREACRAWLEFANEIYPSIRGSEMWWRFQAERMVGRAAWQRIRLVRNYLRGIRHTVSWVGDSLRFQGFATGQQIGWWPDR